MGHREERNGCKSVPQFGGWDQTNPAENTSYTMVFTQARADRKHKKTDLTEFKRSSLGNEQELMAAQVHHNHQNHSDDSVTINGRKSVPEFGAWVKNGDADTTSYTMIFTQARASRKKNKADLTEFKRSSLGNERELLAAQVHHNRPNHRAGNPVTWKQTILTYIGCGKGF